MKNSNFNNFWSIFISNVASILMYFMDRHLYASHTIWQLILPKSIVRFSMANDYGHHSSINSIISQWSQKMLSVAPPMCVRFTHWCSTESSTCPELFHLYPISMHKLGHVYIATCLRTMTFFFYPFGPRGLVTKGLIRWSNVNLIWQGIEFI